MYNNENKGNNMLITTIEHLQGKRITEVLGIVQGSTVRSRAIGKDIVAVWIYKFAFWESTASIR